MCMFMAVGYAFLLGIVCVVCEHYTHGVCINLR